MRPDSLVVASVLAVTVALLLGSLATLATETLAGPRPLATVVLLAVALLGASALGIRSRRRLANPYW
jgi:hypothetical protein